MDKTKVVRFIGMPKALLVLSILLSACTSQPPQPAPTVPVQSTATTQPVATAIPTQSPGATPQPTPVEPTRTAVPPTIVASCTPTQPDMEGPFYKPNAPQRSSVGKGHTLTGVVRSSKDCAPMANVQIEFWMANPNGDYDDDHRATMFSDSSGAYKFESNLPPPYSGRPPHNPHPGHSPGLPNAHHAILSRARSGTGHV